MASLAPPSAENARRQVFQGCQSAPGRARFKDKPSAYRQAGPLCLQRSSASACSPSPSLGHRDRQDSEQKRECKKLRL